MYKLFILVVFMAIFVLGCTNTDQVFSEILPKVYEKIEETQFIDKILEKLIERVSTKSINFKTTFFETLRNLGKTMEFFIDKKNTSILATTRAMQGENLSRDNQKFCLAFLKSDFLKEKEKKSKNPPQQNPSRAGLLLVGDSLSGLCNKTGEKKY